MDKLPNKKAIKNITKILRKEGKFSYKRRNTIENKKTDIIKKAKPKSNIKEEPKQTKEKKEPCGKIELHHNRRYSYNYHLKKEETVRINTYNNITPKEINKNKLPDLDSNSDLDNLMHQNKDDLEIKLKPIKHNFKKPEEAQAESSNKSENSNSQQRNINRKNHNYLETNNKKKSLLKKDYLFNIRKNMSKLLELPRIRTQEVFFNSLREENTNLVKDLLKNLKDSNADLVKDLFKNQEDSNANLVKDLLKNLKDSNADLVKQIFANQKEDNANLLNDLFKKFNKQKENDA